MRRTKGFTLVELLVVIAIIALLMGILMPALARVRAIAFRMTCGTNLSGIGKAMLIYANDYEDEFPVAGWQNGEFAYALQPLLDAWRADSRAGAFGVDPGAATITSCFYVLVKLADVPTKSFVCKSDSGVSEFKLYDFIDESSGLELELIDVWDFGPWGTDEGVSGEDSSPDFRCSYAYHLPFEHMYTLTTSSDPSFPVAADPNPWFIHAGQDVEDVKNFPGVRYVDEGPYGSLAPFIPSDFPDTEHIKYGNSTVHQEEGQNVLFLDGHVAFEKNSFCGIEEDNIYTIYDGGDIRQGDPFLETEGSKVPVSRRDAYLVGNRADTDDPEYDYP
jgi:prepilin-type N-terminal cleavage/methylation domain-containing protein/prepilin-type processing-associated H-X9-DG protein